MLRQKEPMLSVLLNEFIEAGLDEFKEVYDEHPLKEGPNDGAVSVSEAFWLYWLIKELEPKLIVESGTLRGYSLYFLRRAAPEGAAVHGFDPYNEPEALPDGVAFHAYDWTDWDFGAPPERSLVFFDDHRSHALRMGQAWQRGFRWALFHDNYTTTGHDVWPLRFCGVGNKARTCFTLPRLDCDEIFTDRTDNPQNYRWLTFVELLL